MIASSQWSQYHLAGSPGKVLALEQRVWKRFLRLSRSGTFEAFFDALAAMSETAHLVQMFDSTVMRAHVSAAGGLPTAFHLTGGEASDSRNF